MGLLDAFLAKPQDEQREALLGMASIMSGMSHSPNVALQQMAQQGIKDIRSKREKQAGLEALEGQKASVAKWLTGKGRGDLAQQLLAGGFDVKTALEIFKQKTPERKIVKGGDGFNYYADTGERVLPDVQKQQVVQLTGSQLKEKGLVSGDAVVEDTSLYNIKPDGTVSKIGSGINIDLGTKETQKRAIADASTIVMEERGKAQAAVQNIMSVNAIRPLLTDVYSGPLAEHQVLVDRLATSMGISGADHQQKLNNTAAAMQELAKIELQAASGMKGQGQITEGERAILQKTAGGDLMKLTAGEVETLIDAIDKISRWKIANYQKIAQPLLQTEAYSPFASMYEITAPQPYIPAGVTVKRKK